MSRLRRDQARVVVYDGGASRLLVRWNSAQAQYHRDILASFRETFPRHSDAVYSPGIRAWSVPYRHADRLSCWLIGTFEPYAIVWDDGPGALTRAGRAS